MPLTVLLTGFGPFPGAPYNPTAALVHALARVRDRQRELIHGQYARHAEFADDEGRRAIETESLGLLVVARKNAVDRLFIGGQIALGAIDMIVDRREMRDRIAALLRLLLKLPAAVA